VYETLKGSPEGGVKIVSWVFDVSRRCCVG
jgi:hypothetical protein